MSPGIDEGLNSTFIILLAFVQILDLHFPNTQPSPTTKTLALLFTHYHEFLKQPMELC